MAIPLLVPILASGAVMALTSRNSVRDDAEASTHAAAETIEKLSSERQRDESERAEKMRAKAVAAWAKAKIAKAWGDDSGERVQSHVATEATEAAKRASARARAAKADKQRAQAAKKKTRKSAGKLSPSREVAAKSQAAAATRSKHAKQDSRLARHHKSPLARAEAARSVGKAHAAIDADSATPAPKAGKGFSPAQAAQAMRAYLLANRTPDAYGSKKKPSARIAAWQKEMQRLKADGIVGVKTMSRARALKVTLPPRPKATPKKKDVGPAQAEKVDKQSKATAKDYAVALKDYLKKNHTAAAYGFRNHPSEPVRAFQAASAPAAGPADGIYGKRTKDAARKLGVLLPGRPKK